MTASCRQQPKIKLLTVKALNSFPSASAIEYNEGRFYILGDDAAYMLVLDSSFNQVDTVRYLTDTNYRIPKEIKVDIESATIVPYVNNNYLYALGSFSTSNRMKLYFFPLKDIRAWKGLDVSTPFIIDHPSVPEVNFEGLAFVKSKQIIANRANTTHKVNQLILGGSDNPGFIATASSPLIDVILDSTKNIGISGLCYSEAEDKLFFTASEEDTPGATQDGVIGNSYIGWFNQFSAKINGRSLKPDGMIDLSKVDKAFDKQKIESICIEKTTGKEFILDLVSDDDKGHSMIFRIRLSY